MVLKDCGTQCTGLAGGGELLLETYRATGDPRWRERAIEFARLGLAYRESTPAGDAWPTDAPGLYSADFDYEPIPKIDGAPFGQKPGRRKARTARGILARL